MLVNILRVFLILAVVSVLVFSIFGLVRDLTTKKDGVKNNENKNKE